MLDHYVWLGVHFVTLRRPGRILSGMGFTAAEALDDLAEIIAVIG